MYTHLIISKASAEELYPLVIEFAAQIGRRKVRDSGVCVGETLDDHFDQYGTAFIRQLDCEMVLQHTTGLFVLKFREYLAEVPRLLQEMEVEIVGVEIVRFQSAPTRAKAGFYRWAEDATATVERVFPTQHDQYKKPAPLYAQNITVRAGSLAKAIEFNSKLGQGFFNRFLVHAWE